MTDDETSPDARDQRDLQVAIYLWEEYRYRHDLVWQLIFRVTAVSTALLITPFLTNESVRKVVGDGLLFLPGLAILVILIGFYVLQCELRLLKKIRDAYREAQGRALDYLKPHWDPHEIRPSRAERTLWRKVIEFRADHFEGRVSLFLVLILLAALAFFFFFWVDWLPKMQ